MATQSEMLDDLAAIQARVVQLVAQTQALRAERDEVVRALHGLGVTQYRLAQVLGIRAPAVAKILKQEKDGKS